MLFGVLPLPLMGMLAYGGVGALATLAGVEAKQHGGVQPGLQAALSAATLLLASCSCVLM